MKLTSLPGLGVESVIKLNQFKPRSYQLPILDAIENKGYKRVLSIMPRRCLSGDTHITMADGSFKLLKDIEPGDWVLSFDGNGFVPDKVKDAWRTSMKDTVEVVTRGNIPLISSYDHVFASVSSFDDKVSWSPLKDLSKNRRLLGYSGIRGNSHCERIAELWGYLLTDGYVSGYQQPKFTNNNLDILNRVEKLVCDLFDINVIWRKKGNGFDLGLSNGTRGGGSYKNPIKDLFRSNGLDVPKSKQRLPTRVWEFNDDSIYRFIAAIISCDGSIYVQSEHDRLSNHVPSTVEITMSCGTSYNYAFDLYWLLRKIGITVHLPKCERGSNWKLRISAQDSVKKLLSVPIVGKIQAQNRALKAVSAHKKHRKTVNSCYFLSYKLNKSHPQVLFDIETERHHNFVANGLIVHNSGKDVTAFNLCIRQCLRKICVVYYVFPSYAQAKKVIWDSITNTGERILDFIPPALIESKNSQEMKIRFKNGSLLQLVGSDNFDSLVGTNPQGVVFSEYALQDPRAYQFIRPILVANDGWALFISTPRGKNHLWEMYQIAQQSDDWFAQKLTVHDTGHISLHEIAKEKAEGLMSEDLIQQEYYTSFELGVEGSYYGKYLEKMEIKGQIGQVPWEAGFKVHTAWDLGVRDSTSIIFFQTIGQTVRVIDCYENSKHGLEHYINMLQSKPYTYGMHIAPHDIKVREFGSGITRLEKARQLGVHFTTAPDVSVIDGIEAVRTMLTKTWIDKEQGDILLKALENYRQEFDSKKKVYKQNPLHNWASHFADAARYMAISLPKTHDGMSAQDLERQRREALYGSDQMPSFFRDHHNHY